jgi:hypothetical protein
VDSVARVSDACGPRGDPPRVRTSTPAWDDKERALECPGKPFEERSWALIYLKADPRFDGLRSDSRFAALVRRMGLKP